MRKAVRAAVLVVLGLLSTAVMGAVAALMAALSLAATTALIVPGTGTPNANVVDDYMGNFWDRYIGGTDPALPAECTTAADCTLTGINYPASFFPLVVFPGWCEPGRCETWNTSVGEGVTNLNSTLIDRLVNTSDDIILAGYSQGGAVVSNEMRNLADLSPELKERLSVFMIGNAYNPDGGIFTRLGFLPTIPFIDVTFGPAMPTDIGIDITSVGFEYDPVMYAPLYWGNPFAMLNALAAFDTVHGYYLTPNGNGPTDSIAYGYTEDELATILDGPCPGPNCRVDAEGNRYFMIPAKSLPLMDLMTSLVPGPLKPFVQPIVDLTSPVLEVLINLGYDWSGDPGQTRFLSVLPFNPFQNWAQVGVDLVEAVVEGIENAFGGGSTVMIAPPADTNLASFSAPAIESESTVDPQPVQRRQSSEQKQIALVGEQSGVVEGEVDGGVEGDLGGDVVTEEPTTDTTVGSETDDSKTDDSKTDDSKTDEDEALGEDETEGEGLGEDETEGVGTGDVGTGDVEPNPTTVGNAGDTDAGGTDDGGTDDNDQNADGSTDADNDSDNDSDSGQAAA